MEERRNLKRRHLIYYLRVFNSKTDQLIGHLVDITHKGIMLISEEPIETNAIFQLRMIFLSEIDRRKEIGFNAKSLWCKKDINPDFFDTGFQLIDVPKEDILIFEHLIRSFAMDN